MSALTQAPVVLDDLHNIEGKAELVNGEIILMSPTGKWPGRAARRITRSLEDHEDRTKSGFAFGDNVGFSVHLPERNSFSPDAAFFVGEINWDDAATAGDFVDGAPTFAVEVRSKNDYGKEAERKIKAKIADYFAAGTLVVWDADVLREKIVRKYCSTDPDNPTVFRRGEPADAEPAVPGWTFPVDELFA